MWGVCHAKFLHSSSQCFQSISEQYKENSLLQFTWQSFSSCSNKSRALNTTTRDKCYNFFFFFFFHSFSHHSQSTMPISQLEYAQQPSSLYIQIKLSTKPEIINGRRQKYWHERDNHSTPHHCTSPSTTPAPHTASTPQESATQGRHKRRDSSHHGGLESW